MEVKPVQRGCAHSIEVPDVTVIVLHSFDLHTVFLL